jgi:protein ImuA
MAARHVLDQLRQAISPVRFTLHDGKERPPRLGLSEIDRHLARAGLGAGAVHEVAGNGLDEEQGAMGAGFLALWLRHCAPSRPILWATSHADLYPPGLAGLGLDPGRLILLDIRREREIGWALEEALRSGALGAVVGEMARIDLTASRRLQLAAEKIGIPCFILRRWPSVELARHHRDRPIAAATRWRILPAPGARNEDGIENVDKAAGWSNCGDAATGGRRPGSWRSRMAPRILPSSRRFLSLWLTHWATDCRTRRKTTTAGAVRWGLRRPSSSPSAATITG